MSRVFNQVAGNAPKLNRFDWSYTNITSMSIGYLYPVQCDEVYPGTVLKMKAFCHAEAMPMIAPLMSDLQMYVHTFFCPYRLLYGFADDGQPIWEKFITGGKDGDYDTALPAWTPSFTDTGFSSKKIWDYIGNPVQYTAGTGWTPLVPPSNPYTNSDLNGNGVVSGNVLTGLDVSIAPKRAYNWIVNNYYIDETLNTPVNEDSEDLFVVSFKKDYFTSALLDQQRGTAPALPVDISLTGSSPVIWSTSAGGTVGLGNYIAPIISDTAKENLFIKGYSSATTLPADNTEITSSYAAFKGSVNPSSFTVAATTFTPSDLRLAFAIQRMQELASVSGYRYTEWLSANFNAHPTDARLDRPEYIGGCIMPVNVSPLVQTSGTWDSTAEASAEQVTPQGNKSGIGSIDSIQKIGNYRVLEHGLVMTLVSIRPKPIYQQGINRQWLRQTRFDYYNPALAYLSEQAVYNAELFVDETSDDADIFGYQAHWNELRCKNNMITGAVRNQFEYYALGRKFATRPHLNADFLKIKDSDFNHVFAVQNEDEFVVSWSNIIDAYVPIPQFGTPGLIDHVYGGR